MRIDGMPARVKSAFRTFLKSEVTESSWVSTHVRETSVLFGTLIYCPGWAWHTLTVSGLLRSSAEDSGVSVPLV